MVWTKAADGIEPEHLSALGRGPAASVRTTDLASAPPAPPPPAVFVPVIAATIVVAATAAAVVTTTSARANVSLYDQTLLLFFH